LGSNDVEEGKGDVAVEVSEDGLEELGLDASGKGTMCMATHDLEIDLIGRS
jgi:hypothetical protein